MRDLINDYIKKYGYDFVLEACDEAENRKIYLKRAGDKRKEAENIAKLKRRAEELGVKLKG